MSQVLHCPEHSTNEGAADSGAGKSLNEENRKMPAISVSGRCLLSSSDDPSA